MATTKAPIAKQAAPKKTAANKTTRKAAPRKATAGKASTTNDAVRESIASVTRRVDDTVKQHAADVGDQVVEFVRGVVDIYVGIPFVLQARLADGPSVAKVDIEAVKALVIDAKDRLSERPSVDFDGLKAFIDEAKDEGHARVASLQSRFEPVAKDVTKRFDGVAQKLEAQLPSQFGELFESGRSRLRNLRAA